MGHFIKKKSNPITFQSRLMQFMAGMIVMTVVLLLLSMVFLGLMSRNYQNNMQQLLNLNSFYRHLDSVNRNVYEYTLEGDEDIYNAIGSEVMQGRRILKEMTQMRMGKEFYRDIRDMEDFQWLHPEMWHCLAVVQ